MAEVQWPPHVTVATLVVRGDEFLFVLEHTERGLRLNQPAGHLEPGERLVDAALRETREETGWQVELTGYLGVSCYDAPNGSLYVRNTYVARPLACDPDPVLDDGIVETRWLTYPALLECQDIWRSPLVGEVVRQYLELGASALELGSLHR